MTAQTDKKRKSADPKKQPEDQKNGNKPEAYGDNDVRHGPDEDDIPLREALVVFMSENLEDQEDRRKQLTEITNNINRRYGKYSEAKFIVSYSMVFFVVVFFLVGLISLRTNPAVARLSLNISFFLILAAVIPLLTWNIFEYGWKRLEEPITLPYDSEALIDEFLGVLQKESFYNSPLPRAYYYPRFSKKPIYIRRRQFFSKFRYLLFSEHLSVRHVVTRYRGALSAPADIFIRRSDLEKMIADSKPKRKGGPGRILSSKYADAIIAMIGDERLLRLGLGDREKAISQIVVWLNEPSAKAPDESGWKPNPSHIKTYAEKIYARMKSLRSSGRQ